MRFSIYSSARSRRALCSTKLSLRTTELLQGEVTTKFVEEAVVAKVIFFVLVPRQAALYSESLSVTTVFPSQGFE